LKYDENIIMVKVILDALAIYETDENERTALHSAAHAKPEATMDWHMFQKITSPYRNTPLEKPGMVISENLKEEVLIMRSQFGCHCGR
jgi:hypothetical protein